MPFPLLLSYKQTERNLKRLNLNLLFKGQNSETLTFFFCFSFGVTKRGLEPGRGLELGGPTLCLLPEESWGLAGLSWMVPAMAVKSWGWGLWAVGLVQGG